MGRMDTEILKIFGSAANFFFPIILIFMTLINFFDVYKKILSAFGLKQFEFSEEFNDSLIEEGKFLLLRG